MPFRRPGSPYWHYDRTITIEGQRHRIRGSTGIRGSKREAQAVEDQEIAAARDQIRNGPAPARLTFDEAIGTYCAQVASHQPSWRTSRSQAKALLKGLGKRTALAALTTADLSAHVAKRRALVANATVNRELQFLRRVVRYADAVLGAAAPEIDWRSLALREAAERVRELTAAEETRLFAKLRPDFRPLVRFALIAGCRVGNAVRLEWRDVDFAARVVVLREMKGDRHHVVPMTRAMLALLSAQPRVRTHPDLPADRARVFTYAFRGTKKRRPFSEAGWKKPWWAALDAAGIADFRFHDLRHTSLSRITRAKGLKAAQNLAGHASIATTARYAHCELDELREAMERVGGELHPQSTHNAKDGVA